MTKQAGTGEEQGGAGGLLDLTQPTHRHGLGECHPEACRSGLVVTGVGRRPGGPGARPKAAVHALGRVWSNELAPRGVRVTTLRADTSDIADSDRLICPAAAAGYSRRREPTST